MSKNRVGHWLQPDWKSGSHLDRAAAIERFVRGVDVLDVGAASGHHRSDWMHAQIAKVARRVVGVDIDESGVNAARAKGFDVRLIDAQGGDLGERFDVAFAGELIEHLVDPQSFLAMVRRHLKPEGILVLTTPNAFAFSNFVYRFGGKARIHREHTCWYCEDTLTTLLGRCGFIVSEVTYLSHKTPGSVRRVMANAARSALPDRLAWRTLMVAARPG